MKRIHSKKRVGLLAGLIIGILAVCTLLAWRVHQSRQNHAVSSDDPMSAYANGREAPETKLPQRDPNPDPNVPGGSTGANNSSDIAVMTPTGTFVSNHRVSLKDQLSSVCMTNTTANCSIQFTKGSITKSLEAKIAQPDKIGGGNGTAAWNWTPQDIGLSPGSWHVKAEATLNGQSKSAEDVTTLEVMQ